ncbi:MAG: ATP-binding protein [Phycisphaerales bacterium]|nr:ATP-binding protein [Phycisphaerae bacterium]NNF43985.1 ATP-binding protein [Phycisphaerales bacterium]NNM27789.1 ATP-binding protein [Phycisphaerales bacterium]
MGETDRQADIHVHMFSQARWLAAVRAMAGSFAQRTGFSEILSGQISLAIDEALCNVINHGYERRPDGPIWIDFHHLALDPPGLEIVITDRARQVEPDSIQPRALEDIRPGGLGVYIIREIMDRVVYEQRTDGGMRLTMMKQLPPSPPAGTSGAVSSKCDADQGKA